MQHQSAYSRSFRGRQDNRQPNRRPPGGAKTVASINLGRMANILSMDVLASALGMAEPVLFKIVQGHDVGQDYQAHIEHRLREANIPTAWLNQTGAQLGQSLVDGLRRIASTSENKAPIRRQNFQTLIDGFGGSLDIMADSLEMVESSIRAVAAGQLPIDAERFNHINPKLMAAGFPDGWLDQPQAQANPEWLATLKALADAEAQAYAQQDAELRKAHLQAEADAEAKAAEAPSPVQATLLDATTESATEHPPQAAEASTPVEPKAPPALESKLTVPSVSLKESKDMTAKKTTASFKPGNLQGAVRPSAAALLPRGALNAGRALNIKPAAGAAAKASPTAQEKPATLAARKVHLIPKKAAAPAPASAAASSTPEAPNTRAGKTPVSRETSSARAIALEQLLSTARRGAKVTLWRDLLKSSLPYWGNIRNGTVLMRDELADSITQHLGLPAGWLDNPVFPPPTLAAWVTDRNAPVPGLATVPAPVAPAVTTPPAARKNAAVSAKKTFARETPSAPTLLAPATAPTSTQPSATRPGPTTKPSPARKTSVAAAPAPAAAPASATSTVELSAAAHASAHATDSLAQANAGVFSWRPAADPKPIPAPGPLVQALTLVINQASINGTFTDEDALRLIALLVTSR